MPKVKTLEGVAGKAPLADRDLVTVLLVEVNEWREFGKISDATRRQSDRIYTRWVEEQFVASTNPGRANEIAGGEE